jgi:hypothetical protein
MSLEAAKQVRRAPLLAFLALVVLTAAELAVLRAGGGRAGRVTALVALLFVKVTVVLGTFMRAQSSRRAARLTLLAIGIAAVFAVVLMLEAASQLGPE